MTPVQLLRRVCGIVGALLLLLAAVLWFDASKFIDRSARTQGQVVKLLHVKGDADAHGGDGTWRPMVRFTARAGQIVEFSSSGSSNPPAYAEGDRVEVLYSLTNPQDAKISTFFSLWAGPLVTGGLALVFLLATGILMRVPANAWPRGKLHRR